MKQMHVFGLENMCDFLERLKGKTAIVTGGNIQLSSICLI